LIAVRYSLNGTGPWPAVELELTPTGDNDAVNMSRYSQGSTSACPMPNGVSLTLPQLDPGHLVVLSLCAAVVIGYITGLVRSSVCLSV